MTRFALLGIPSGVEDVERARTMTLSNRMGHIDIALLYRIVGGIGCYVTELLTVTLALANPSIVAAFALCEQQ